jgi:hypothetical protein
VLKNDDSYSNPPERTFADNSVAITIYTDCIREAILLARDFILWYSGCESDILMRRDETWSANPIIYYV